MNAPPCNEEPTGTLVHSHELGPRKIEIGVDRLQDCLEAGSPSIVDKLKLNNDLKKGLPKVELKASPEKASGVPIAVDSDDVKMDDVTPRRSNRKLQYYPNLRTFTGEGDVGETRDACEASEVIEISEVSDTEAELLDTQAKNETSDERCQTPKRSNSGKSYERALLNRQPASQSSKTFTPGKRNKLKIPSIFASPSIPQNSLDLASPAAVPKMKIVPSFSFSPLPDSNNDVTSSTATAGSVQVLEKPDSTINDDNAKAKRYAKIKRKLAKKKIQQEIEALSAKIQETKLHMSEKSLNVDALEELEHHDSSTSAAVAKALEDSCHEYEQIIQETETAHEPRDDDLHPTTLLLASLPTEGKQRPTTNSSLSSLSVESDGTDDHEFNLSAWNLEDNDDDTTKGHNRKKQPLAVVGNASAASLLAESEYVDETSEETIPPPTAGSPIRRFLVRRKSATPGGAVRPAPQRRRSFFVRRRKSHKQ